MNKILKLTLCNDKTLLVFLNDISYIKRHEVIHVFGHFNSKVYLKSNNNILDVKDTIEQIETLINQK